ncbi:MAG: glycoside hydrolase family 15 protein [Terracoccus sp.]
MSTTTSPPQHVLREYAFLADGHRGALIGPRGDVAWLCTPRWDSPAVLASLVGGRGSYAVTPRDPFVWGGYYEPGSLVWRSRWTTTSTVIECREALATPGDPHRAVLLRRIEAVDGRAAVSITLDLRADFGRAGLRTRRDDHGRWLFDGDGVQARWSGLPDARPDGDGILHATVEIPAGGHLDLVLEVGDHPLGAPVDPERAWRDTERYWRDAVPDFSRSAAPRDSAHAYAVLRGLTTPGGGMVAAPTLGLPERAEAGRNYDYRYVWLRDQAYAGIAVAVDEPLPLLDEFVSVTTARVLEHGGDLAPAYAVDGSLPPEQSRLHLPGYPGGADVVGNWVRQQFQLDALGELLQLYAVAAGHDHLGIDDRRAVQVLIDLIGRRWNEPDAGVWELDNAWWTHSRLACVAGLRRIEPFVPAGSRHEVTALADLILAETTRRCLRPDGAWLQRPDEPGLDAALLLPPVRGALSPSDPRSVATLRAIEADLTQDGYLYRYRKDDQPLGSAEGAFLMCGFAMSLAQLAAGDEVAAYRWFERQRAATGPANLLAEEFDVSQRQLRGNLPQGFVHALLLESSQRLGAVG